MKDIALVTLHGMGKENRNYFVDLEEGLKRRLGNDWSRISFQNVQYARVLQEPQEQLWQDIVAAPENDVDYTRLRKFFLYGFSDAASLEYSAHNNQVQYLEVQKEIQNALSRAYLDLDQDPSKPVVIIAQSLGCQVISNYLWDAEHDKYIFENTHGIDPDELAFLHLKSLHNLMTTGCNIPLFIGGISDRKSFRQPHPQFKWDNYYDPDDILGWPLRQLGPSFNAIRDHDINSGGLLTSWNPLSHLQYWRDSDVIRPLADTLRALLP